MNAGPLALVAPGVPLEPSRAAVEALEQLTPREAQVVRGLADNLMSVKAAAKAVGLTDRSVHRVMERPHVRRAVAAMAADGMRQGLGRTLTLYGRAVNVLAEQLDSKNPWLRLEAARALSNLALRALELTNLGDAIADLQRQVAEVQAARNGGGGA